MRQYSYMNTEKATFSTGSKSTVKINRTGYITDIVCLLKVTLSGAAATLVGTWPDNMARLIKSVRLYSGSINYFTVDDGREWFWDNFFHYGGKVLPFVTAAVAKQPGPESPFGSAATTYYLPLRIHLGTDKTNPYDPTGVIPARELSQLNLEIEWGGAQSDFDSNASPTFAISSGEMTFAISEVQLEPGESRDSVFPQGLVSPRFEPYPLTPPSTDPANLAWKHETPVGDTLVYSVIIVLDNDIRSDDRITEVGIEIPKMREKPFRINWYDLIALNKTMYGFPFPNEFGVDQGANAHPLGAAIFPWSLVSGKPTGLDASAFLPGDVKLSFSGSGLNVSQDKVLVLHYLAG